MPKYKLTYFDVQARAEPIRLIFAAGGIPYEDCRITYAEWFPLKPKTSMGGLPVLEVDGVMLSQSLAIARYVAKKAGLVGKTEIEDVQVDAIGDLVNEYFNEVPKVHFQFDEKLKAEAKKAFLEEIQPKLLGVLDKNLKLNKGGDGFFVGSSMTWPDLAFCNAVEFSKACGILPKGLDDFPKLKALMARVYAQPKVAEYIAKRPKQVAPNLDQIKQARVLIAEHEKKK